MVDMLKYQEYFQGYGYYTFGYTYDAYIDITPYIDWQKASGTYTIANIPTREGMTRSGNQNDGLGNFGAWTMVVIYQSDKNLKGEPQEPRNVSIYDGYKRVYNTDEAAVDIHVSGFFTPTSGPVHSLFGVFVGEGDKYIKGDTASINDVKLTNEAGESDNFFDSTISPSITRTPSLINNNGIDIHMLQVGRDGDDSHPQIIGNGETEANISLTSSGDYYLPSMVAFSTEIYQPKICYEEQYFTADGREINGSTVIHTGEPFVVKLTVRNDANETARNVVIQKQFDDNVTYIQNSTAVKNVLETQMIHYDDNTGPVKYSKETKLWEVSLGDQNGEFKSYYQDNRYVADINYTTAIFAEGNYTKFNYRTSYTYTIAGHQFDVNSTLPKCTPGENSIGIYAPPLGVINVVHAGATFAGNSDPTDPLAPENALYTQIANKPFAIKVVHLDNDFTTLKAFNGPVFLEVVSGDGLTGSTQEELQNQCASAAPIVKMDGNISVFPLSLQNAAKSIDINDITIKRAIDNAVFRAKFVDWNALFVAKQFPCSNSSQNGNLKGVPACIDNDAKFNSLFPQGDPAFRCLHESATGEPCLSNHHGIGLAPYNHLYGCAQCIADAYPTYTCSRDRFAVRPATFDFDLNETSPLIGNRFYSMDVLAQPYASTGATVGYDQTIDGSADKNITTRLTPPAGCSLPTTVTVNGASITFSDGNATNVLFKFSNIGDINVTIEDNNWTKVDQIAKSDGSIDCIANSATTTADGNGQIGCLIKKTKPFRFVPLAFLHDAVQIKNHNDAAGFTYVSNQSDMSASLILTIKALLDDATPSNLYDNAVATNYTAACFAKDVDLNVSLIHSFGLNWGTTGSRIHYFSGQNGSTIYDPATKRFTVPSSRFNSGQATQVMAMFDFDRNASLKDNPFILPLADFNITTRDIDNVAGADFNRSIDDNATFYYARLHAPDYSTDSNTISTPIYAEVFCDSTPAVCAGYGIANWKESPDDVNWWVNPNHTINDGNITALTPKIGFSDQNDTSVGVTYSNTLTNGVFATPQVTYNGSDRPHKTQIRIGTQSWLKYHRFITDVNKMLYYNVEFLGRGGWAGVGQKGQTLPDINGTNERIEW